MSVRSAPQFADPARRVRGDGLGAVALMDRNIEKNLVRERVSLRDIVAETVGEFESRGGDDLWACCPFHNENTSSFHVRPALGVFKCFGCGASGDVFSFVQMTRGIGFREALELLAERAGVELGSVGPEERERQEQKRHSRQVLEAALVLFRRELARPGNPAAAYMHARGFSDDLLRRFDIGCVPQDLRRSLRSTRVEEAAIDAAGFTGQFGGRVAFGIRDGNGALVGFGARRLADQDERLPKYVNTRETAWFAKRRLLYGLDKATRTLARSRRLVVMEGYTDVMAAHARGVTEAVATMGTSFTEDHLKLVKGRVSNLVLVFDGDEAGRTAAERTVRMVLAGGMESRVLLLAADTDPCDWFRENGREEFDALLAQQSLSGVAFLCERGLQRMDPGQPGGREALAGEVLALVTRLEDPVRRETIVADVAAKCGLDRNVLRRAPGGSIETGLQPGPAASPRNRRAPAGRPVPARIRCQYSVLAGLPGHPARLAELQELVSSGVIAEPGARALIELAAAIQQREGRLEASDWLEACEEQQSGLRATLEDLLLPPPGALPCDREAELDYLRKMHAEDQRREQQRAVPLDRSDAEMLRGIQAGILRSRQQGPRAAGGAAAP